MSTDNGAIGPEVRAAIDAGDADALARLIASDELAASCQIVWGEPGDDGEAPNRCSALHYVANARFHGTCLDGDPVELATLLLDAGADADWGGRVAIGETVLQTAVSLYERDLAELLLDRGASLETLGGCVDNGTALALAAHFAATEALELLVERGARIYNLPLAAAVGELWRFVKPAGVLATALQRHPADPNRQPLYRDLGQALARAVHYAAIHERAEVLDRLIELGADVNAVEGGATALHRVAWWGREVGAELLLERGADRRLRDAGHKTTPAQWAEVRGHGELARVLARGTW
ncbi:ankyrin repeat domain-containing protein [Engelhardtia mirabilis]|uniref:Ankyrin repeats (3 copies) n=1 Tax=Engelhardtia mirabilis TaxID=2528011 RepID=A0A518BHH3_9BACT|nr:Ankyrin repeats (3 copies) [Planctomycetes bacterium Pla133]QDV00742.1 Ankyrin repeats (3 copies) [Planctomycetes bacterium Pla86]